MTTRTPKAAGSFVPDPSPRVAAILSYLMPGLGHAYAGDLRRGVTIWLAMAVLFLVGEVVWVTGPHVYLPDAWMWLFIFLTFGASVARSAGETARNCAHETQAHRALHHHTLPDARHLYAGRADG